MENQNILTIKFNTLDDLAVQVADWHERLNHECCGNCHDSKALTEAVCETIDVETVTPKVESKTAKAEKVVVKEEKVSNKVAKAEQEQDIHVTDFECNPTKPKNEENGESVAKPAEGTKVEEPTPLETPKQDTELDVVAEPVDKKAFFREMKSWMGKDKGRAGKIIAVFNKYGVTERFSSDVLTNDIITDLKTVMVEEE